MMNLRPYQNDSIHGLRDGFRERHLRQVLCLPTGAGKTVVFSEMARMAAERGTRTLVLTDRVELFKQTMAAIDRTGHIAQLVNAASKGEPRPDAVVTLGMVETVKRRVANWPNFTPDLIIIDEAHKGNFTSILDTYPHARVIGATATPIGKHFYKYYTNIVSPIDIPELIDGGFLAPCKAFQMVEDLSDLDTKAGEYTDSSLTAHYNRPKLFDGVIEQYREKANGTKAIIFNVNIEHAENVTAAFNEAGIPSRCVTSKTPTEERTRTLAAFKAGAFPVLNNCGILTTGYDEPSIETVIMNRATKSLTLWLQCCGRGSRTFDRKDFFTVLDFGMNHKQHDRWDAPREWRIEPPRKKRKGEDVAPVKECPKCQSMLHASAMACKWCGFDLPRPERQPLQGEMVEVAPKSPTHLIGRKVSDLSIDELIEMQRSKRYKATFIWRVVRSHGVVDIEAYAGQMGYSKGWIKRQIDDIDNSTFTDYTIR